MHNPDGDVRLTAVPGRGFRFLPTVSGEGRVGEGGSTVRLFDRPFYASETNFSNDERRTTGQNEHLLGLANVPSGHGAVLPALLALNLGQLSNLYPGNRLGRGCVGLEN
ncbi:MAG: hypothetical protein BRD25_02360, partial [Bacteroidetes bacterium QH_1_61_8]